MAQMKRVPTDELRKAREQMKSKSKVKITGTATTTPRVSASMSKSQPKTTSKSKTPQRKMPEGFEFPRNKKTVPNPPGVPRTPASGTKKPLPKIVGAKPGARQLMSKTTTKAPAKITPKPKTTKKPEKMTPQDAAMKKILEGKYGKIYG